MAKTLQEMLEQFQSFIPYVMTFKDMDEQNWDSPISEGKWTLKELLGHIMKWDQYFYEEAIHPITLNEPVTAKHLNFDEFNAEAAAYAKAQTVEKLIHQFVEYRSKIIDDITRLSEEQVNRAYKDGDGKKFNVKSYVRSFIAHDKHHQKQMDAFLKRLA